MWMRKANISKWNRAARDIFNCRIATQCNKAKLAAATPQTKYDKDEELRYAKPFDEVPGAQILPLFGTMWRTLPPFNKNFDLKRHYDLTVNRHKRYGPIWRDVIPLKGNLVHITTAEDTEKLFRLDGKYPARMPFESLKKYREDRIEQFSTAGILATDWKTSLVFKITNLSSKVAALDNLLLKANELKELYSNGEEWWRVRSKAQQPMLKPQNTLLYLPSMAEVAEQMINRIRKIRNKNNEVPDDFITEMYKWALESVSLVALDTRLGCLDDNVAVDSEPRKMIESVIQAIDCLFKLEISLQLYRIFPINKDWRKLVEAQNYFTETSLKYINQAMERIRSKTDADSDGQLTMLEAMLLRGMDVKEAVTMTIDMLMAGIDTTSNSTSFLFYLLARNPDKQELLRQEVNRVLPSKYTPITIAHLNELHYLKACAKESLRLMPAIAGTSRILNQDTVLSGYFIPKGTMVITHQQLMSRMEKYYPCPDAFIPERWIKGNPLENQASPYTSLPFGFGTRACIGRRLAEQETYLLTIKVLQNFLIEFHHPDLGMEHRILNVPDQPLRFTFVDY